MGQGAGGVRDDGDGHDGDRVEAGGGQGDVPQPVGAEEADRDADGRADGEFQGDLAEEHVPVVDRSGGGEGDDEDDDGGVVEAGLGLQGAGDPRGQGHLAQHGEDRGGVGGGDDGADDQGLPPLQADEVVGAGGGDADADRDADGGQDGRGRKGRPDLLPLRAEAALGEDHDEGRVADDLRQPGVVEGDVADAVLPDGDADPQVQQEAGEAAPGGDPHGRDGDQQHERADEQEFVELVDSQCPVLPLICGWIVPPADDTSLPYLIFNVFLTASRWLTRSPVRFSS